MHLEKDAHNLEITHFPQVTASCFFTELVFQLFVFVVLEGAEGICISGDKGLYPTCPSAVFHSSVGTGSEVLIKRHGGTSVKREICIILCVSPAKRGGVSEKTHTHFLFPNLALSSQENPR